MSSPVRDDAAVRSGHPERAVNDAPCRPKRAFNSAELFGGSRIVAIEHGGETYILRQTSSGKLILTK